MLVAVGKKMLEWPMFREFRRAININQEVTDEFILKTVRSEIKPGSRILDAGAGTVRYKEHFSDCEYLTQDFMSYEDPEGEFRYGKIDYISDIVDIPVEDKSFDAVICTEVLEHIPRPDLAIKEFSRILSPGGRLYMTAPLGSVVHQYPHHYYGGFSPSWYTLFLQKYGFTDIDVTPKKGFFALYASQTTRACLFILQSKKLAHRFLAPFALCALVALPIFLLKLDKHGSASVDPSAEFTIGYMVRAVKA